MASRFKGDVFEWVYFASVTWALLSGALLFANYFLLLTEFYHMKSLTCVERVPSVRN